jgi:hypothetical protein
MSAQKLTLARLESLPRLLTRQLSKRCWHAWASAHRPWRLTSMPSEPAGPAHMLPINIAALLRQHTVEIKAQAPEPLHA